jgi:hypothetical protein
MRRSTHSVQVTTSPDPAAPHLCCPACSRPLEYRRTVVSGRQPVERWDYFECLTCGRFQYRHRTRNVRESPYCDESTADREGRKPSTE